MRSIVLFCVILTGAVVLTSGVVYAYSFEKQMGTTKVVVDESLIQAGFDYNNGDMALDGNNIVWVGRHPDRQHIYRYNFLDRQITQVTNDDVWSCGVDMYGTDVYYADCDNGRMRKVDLNTGITDPLTWCKAAWSINVNKKYAVYKGPSRNQITVHPFNGGNETILDGQGEIVCDIAVSENDYVFWTVYDYTKKKYKCFGYNLNAQSGSAPYVTVTDSWGDYASCETSGDILVYGGIKCAYAYNYKTKLIIASIPGNYITDLAMYGDKVILEEYAGSWLATDYVLYDVTKKTSCVLFENVESTYVRFNKNRVAYGGFGQMAYGSGDIHAALLTFTPEITAITPAEVMCGNQITITGRNFGYEKPSDGHVVFGNGVIENVTDIISWTDTEIKCRVPKDAQSGGIKITNSAGESNAVYVRINPAIYGPVLYKAEAIGPFQINVRWSFPSSIEKGFNVYRRLPGGPFSWLGLAARGSLSYMDTTVQPNMTYEYIVSVIIPNVGEVFPNMGPQFLSATSPILGPILVKAEAKGSRQIDISWSFMCWNETGFNVFRRLPGGPFAYIGTAAQRTLCYSDKTALPNTTYEYIVSVVIPNVGQVFPNWGAQFLSAKTPVEIMPNAPTNLRYAKNGQRGVTVIWSDRSNNETGFKLYRRTGNGPETCIKTLGVNMTGYYDGSVSRNTTYTYRISSYINGQGENSCVNSITVQFA